MADQTENTPEDSPDKGLPAPDDSLVKLLHSLRLEPEMGFVERLRRRLAAGGNVSVLVVEDEEASRTLLRLQLESRGFQVTTADDGAAVLEMPDLQRFDLIVLDQKMPRVTGIEVASKLRGDGNSVPMVIFSGFAEEVERQAQDLGIRAISKTEWDALFLEMGRLVPGTSLNARRPRPQG